MARESMEGLGMLGPMPDMAETGEGPAGGAAGLPPDYEAAIADALPDLTPEQSAALWDAIAACVEALREE